jgi:hypothetical protein
MTSHGYPFLIGAVALAGTAFVLALRVRSWPLWLLAYTMLLLALLAGWLFRDAAGGG